jgi:hypothetical protein
MAGIRHRRQAVEENPILAFYAASMDERTLGGSGGKYREIIKSDL